MVLSLSCIGITQGAFQDPDAQPQARPTQADSQQWNEISPFSKAPQQFQCAAKVENPRSKDPGHLECLHVSVEGGGQGMRST